MNGQVDIPLLQKPSPLMLNLIRDQDHTIFRVNIRAHNMVASTPMGGKIVI